MRGTNIGATAILLSFFVLFTAASVAVPIPLFPGNMISSHLDMSTSEYTPYLGVLTNGLIYGFVTWIIFYMVDKRMEKQ